MLDAGAERLGEYGYERLLLGLRIGDPDQEVLGAWLAKESVRDVYLTEDVEEAAILLDKAILGCQQDAVPELRALGRTLQRWRLEILNHHRTGASNGPTEGMNLCVKKVCAAGTASGTSGTTASGCSSSRVVSSGRIVRVRQPSDQRSPLKCEAPDITRGRCRAGIQIELHFRSSGPSRNGSRPEQPERFGTSLGRESTLVTEWSQTANDAGGEEGTEPEQESAT